MHVLSIKKVNRITVSWHNGSLEDSSLFYYSLPCFWWDLLDCFALFLYFYTILIWQNSKLAILIGIRLDKYTNTYTPRTHTQSHTFQF